MTEERVRGEAANPQGNLSTRTQPADRIADSDKACLLVYLLEPHTATRGRLASLLAGAGYAVEEFDALPELLTRLRDRHPACIVADTSPPDALGLRLLTLLPASDRPPIVLTSLDSELTDAVHAMRAGAADFLEKPVVRSVLLSRLQRLMEKPPGKTR